ncbi:valine--pyruvate transaminase [Verrucomicrobiota bacterium]
MKLSAFGEKFERKSGIGLLMDDLGAALAAGSDMLMLGGGNPSHIPEIQKRMRAEMERVLATEGAFERMIGNYDAAQGKLPFIDALADLLSRTFGWEIGPKNIALTNGSQHSFFCLFNMLAGPQPDGARKKVLFPLCPEYIGYADVGLDDDYFVAQKPEIELIGEDLFKYRVDFDALEVTEDVAAICVSRPTNPTGNVLTDEEIARLDELARANGIPLIIDNAYGLPFPNIIFEDVKPHFNDNTILCMSLSKFGLPGVRTGIIVASEEIISVVSEMNGVMHLAPGSMGAGLALDLVRSGDIIELSRSVVKPHYESKVQQAVAWLREELAGLPCRIHKPEGAIFLWLWFEGLPITSRELYERLRERGTVVVSGHYFFPGLADEWAHRDECLRVSYAMDEETVRAGIRMIAAEVRRAFEETV